VSVSLGHWVFCVQVATKADRLARLLLKVIVESVLMGSKEERATLILPARQSSPLPVTPGRARRQAHSFRGLVGWIQAVTQRFLTGLSSMARRFEDSEKKGGQVFESSRGK